LLLAGDHRRVDFASGCAPPQEGLAAALSKRWLEFLVIGGLVTRALCLAFYTVLLRRANFALERLPLLVVLLAAAAITDLPFYTWEMLHDERTALTPAGILGLAYLAVPGGALMYYLCNWSVQKLGASKAGVLLYSQTVFIAVLAYIFLDECLHFYHLIGAGFILAGVLLVMLPKPQALRQSS
jgi:drug/metabolite transporter (DMT)-like permease